MPIENLDVDMQNDKIVVQSKDVFAQGTTVIAGFLVKNPLYDCKLQLIGFVVYAPSDGQNFVVKGMNYRQPGDNRDYNIYPKILIDLKKNPANHFIDSDSKFSVNYYYYENITDKFAGNWDDNIQAVCKYREDGIIKHAFFNLHELTPDI
jgi:hypothetical protein